MSGRPSDVRIELVDKEEDLEGFWECMYQSFGVQTNDAFVAMLYPKMYTPEGYAAAIEGLKKDWIKDGKGSSTNYWLKATLPVNEGSDDKRKIVGATIWIEALHSRNPPSNDITKKMDIEEIYPGDEREQRFLKQIYTSLFGNRKEVVKQAGLQGYPVMVLDLCCILPEYQGLGIGRKLVQWGLDYASKTGETYGVGTLECYTEGSVMGRPVYERMGFKAESEVEFVVDDEFKDRRTAPNTHLKRPQGLAV